MSWAEETDGREVYREVAPRMDINQIPLTYKNVYLCHDGILCGGHNSASTDKLIQLHITMPDSSPPNLACQCFTTINQRANQG